MGEEDDEPSNFALSISERLIAGDHFILTRDAVASLSTYERAILQKTASRLGYRTEYDFDSGDVAFTKDWTT